jgi:hypothetical protein
MMNHHPHALRTYSVASLITGQVGHFWKADPGQFSKAPKLLGFRTFPNVTSVLEFTDYWKVDPKFLGEQMTLEGVECPALYVPVEKR